MHKGPASYRNLRSIAVTKGAASQGFAEPVVMEDSWKGEYKDRAVYPSANLAVQESDPQPKPFTVR